MPVKKSTRRPRMSKAAAAYAKSLGYRKPARKTYARVASRTNIRESRIVSKVMSAVSESKILPLAEQIEAVGYPTHLGSQGYMYATVLNGVPAPWSQSSWIDMGSVTPAQGTGPNQRIGNQYYLKKTTLQISVDANKRSDPLPMEFRVIVAKPKRSANPTGTTNDPLNSLFLNGNNVQVGPTTTNMTPPQIFNSMINLRDFVVYHDKFETVVGTSFATNALAVNRTTMSNPYKGFFRHRITIPHNIKVHVHADGTISNYDPSAFLVVLARTIGQDDKAGAWNLWLQGTTSYIDN